MSTADIRSISVIVPFYKEIDLIERAIASVTKQVLAPHIQLDVVVGNDSKLSEHDIRAALSRRSNRITRIVKNCRENGAGNARNAALDAAHGDLIAFLDADDYWCGSKLDRQIKLIEAGANFVTGAYRFDGCRKVIRPPARISSSADLFKQLAVGTSTVVERKEFLGRERFRNFRFCQDAEMWARLAGKAGFLFGSTSEVVTVYAPSSRTSNKLRQLLAFAKVVQQFPLGVRDRGEIYLRYMARGVFNHYIRR